MTAPVVYHLRSRLTGDVLPTPYAFATTAILFAERHLPAAAPDLEAIPVDAALSADVDTLAFDALTDAFRDGEAVKSCYTCPACDEGVYYDPDRADAARAHARGCLPLRTLALTEALREAVRCA